MDTNLSAHQTRSDEIDLFELFSQLWNEKKLILLITFILSTCSIAYSFLSTPSYESIAVITPPSEKHLVEIQKIQNLILQTRHNSQINQETTHINPQVIFEQFIGSLNSNRYKFDFLSKPELIQYFSTGGKTKLQARESFEDALIVKLPKKQTKPYSSITLSLRTNSPERSARWLNEYIHYSKTRFITEQTQSINSKIIAAQHGLNLTIQSKKANYLSNLKEEIRSIEEALQIALEIGLENPLNTETVFYKPQALDQIRSIYRLGSKSLRAELKALQARLKSNTPPPGLSDDKLKLELLSSINIQESSIDVMTIDLAAEPNPTQVKPKRAITITISALLGLILGTIISVIKIYITNINATRLIPHED